MFSGLVTDTLSGIFIFPILRVKIPKVRGELQRFLHQMQKFGFSGSSCQNSESWWRATAKVQMYVANSNKNGGPGETRTPNQAVMSRRL